MTQLIPIAAGKGAKEAGKALTGDLYTRRWTSTKGAGKKKREVDHELHVNPVMLAIGAAAAGVAAVGAGVGLWMMQRKLVKTDEHKIVLIIDQFDTTYKTVTETILVRDAYTYTTYIRVPGFPEPIEKVILVPAVYETVTKTVVDKPGYYTVKSKRGVPYKRGEGLADVHKVLTQRQHSLGYIFDGNPENDLPIEGGVRKFWRFKSTNKSTFRLGEREGFLEGFLE